MLQNRLMEQSFSVHHWVCLVWSTVAAQALQ